MKFKLSWQGRTLGTFFLTSVAMWAMYLPANAQLSPKRPPAKSANSGRERPSAEFYTLFSAPLPVLKVELKLTEEQAEKFVATRSKAEEDARGILTGENPPKDQVTYLKRLRDIQTSAEKELTNALDEDQKKTATKTLKDLNILRPLFVPAEAHAELKLTPEQIAKAERMGPAAEQSRKLKMENLREAQRSKDMNRLSIALAALAIAPNPLFVAILTPSQKLTLEKYRTNRFTAPSAPEK